MIKMEDLLPLMEEAFSKNLEFIFKSKGTSMMPLIQNGEKVSLKKAEMLKKNDIVFYRRLSGEFVLHRIYKIKNEVFFMVGDHQAHLEYPIYREQILGKMIAYYKKDERRNLKNVKYRIYCRIWRFLLIRKIYFRFFEKKL